MQAAFHLTAKRIPATDLAQHLANTKGVIDATEEAARILDTARTEAAAIIAAARQSAAADWRDMEQKIRDHAEQVIAATETEAAAIRMSKTLEAGGQLTERFNALTPWIGGLVFDTAAQIIGTFAPDELMRRLLDRALSAAGQHWKQRLRCHPASAQEFHALIQSDRAGENRFRAVIAVTEDANLAPGECVLEHEGGLIEFGLQAQIDALRDAMGLNHAAGYRGQNIEPDEAQ